MELNTVNIKAVIGEDKYLTNISAGSKTLIGDEPIHLGGQDRGFNPYELLASSLGMCTAATIKMYADRKELNLGNITVLVEMIPDPANKTTSFTKHISFENKEIDESTKKRIETIANACPVNKLLHNTIEINTIIK